MLKSLLKKQFMEMNSWFYQDKRNGRRRSLAGKLMYVVLYLMICIALAAVFFGASVFLGEGLIKIHMEWLFFALMGLTAILLGVFGSVFNTYSSLYQAKDNDLLLSLPISPANILIARLFGVWFWGLIFEALVFIPAIAAYIVIGDPTVISIILSFLLVLVISVFVLSLSCILGWVIAQISSRIKNKSFITVILSLAFLGGYYYVYFRAYELLQEVLTHADFIGAKVKGMAYPAYLLGKAAAGDGLSFILFTLIIAALFAIIWVVLSKSFIKMATTKKAAAKRKYSTKQIKSQSVSQALFGRERRRFTSSPVYMLNCGLGSVFLIVAAAALFIKGDLVRQEVLLPLLEEMPEIMGSAVLIMCAGLCTMGSTNDITAPSISLEGRNLWIIQSLPVPMWQVLKSKLRLHIVLTVVPLFMCELASVYVLRPGVFYSIMIVAIPTIFVVFCAAFGLLINLKMPNLKWTDEAVAVKQSAGVMIALFGGWVLTAVLCGAYFLLSLLCGDYINCVNVFLVAVAVILAVAAAGVIYWLKTKGTKILANL